MSQRATFQVQALGGNVTDGFLHYHFGGSIFGGAHTVHGGAYFQNITASKVINYNFIISKCFKEHFLSPTCS